MSKLRISARPNIKTPSLIEYEYKGVYIGNSMVLSSGFFYISDMLRQFIQEHNL